MQLKKNRGLTIAQAVAQASAVLIGTVTPIAAVHAEDSGWKVDTAALFYKESDGRVQAAEPVVSLQKDMGDEKIFNLKLVLDTLTGASPNGAAPANVPQTFTGPSGGESSYTAAPGTTPLDDEFKDTRAAISAGWQQPVGENMRLNVGGNLSNEFDFQSFGLNGALAKDFNNKNTTVSGGINLELDNIKPVGGIPFPMVSMVDKVNGGAGGSDTKTVTDLLLGVTQVLNRHAIVQFNYSLSMANGYQSDPYKLLTVLNTSNNLVTDPSPENTEGYNLYLFEARPDSRTKHSLFTELKYHLTEDVIDASYRYTTDDWGINSNTLDLKYRWELGHNMYLEPHVRWYTQTQADFYKPYLLEGRDVTISGSTVTPQVQYASADSRLGAFDATTFGVKYGIGLGQDSELNFRLEKYDQKASAPAAPATGSLAGQTLQPDLSAMWFQVGYSFRW